jgi:hypothetical protein
MTFSHAPWLVLSVLGLTVVWPCLVAYFFRYIRLRHPAEFSALGEPSFRRGSFRVIGYLFRRGHRSLNDSKLSLLCDVMLVCFTQSWRFIFTHSLSMVGLQVCSPGPNNSFKPKPLRGSA